MKINKTTTDIFNQEYVSEDIYTVFLFFKPLCEQYGIICYNNSTQASACFHIIYRPVNIKSLLYWVHLLGMVSYRVTTISPWTKLAISLFTISPLKLIYIFRREDAT